MNTPSMKGETATASTTQRLTGVQRLLRRSALIAATLLSSVVIIFAGANAFPAGTNIVTLLCAMVWAYAGPHLVVVSVIALALSLPFAVRSLPQHRLARVAALLAAISVIASTFIIGSIVTATVSAGGVINPVTALTFESVDSTPDYIETVNSAGLTVQVFEPAGRSASTPIVMYIHGGGWIGGSAETVASNAAWLADQGFLVINANYRLATPDQAAWEEAPADVACALAWTGANSARFRGDADKISVIGDSAGGNLAVTLAWAAASGQILSSCPEFGTVPVPAAVIGTYPVINPEYTYDYGLEWLLDQRPKDFTSEYLGGSPADYPDRLAAISPLSYASPASPNTLIIEPERDDFVPAQGVYDTVDAARQAGVDVTLARIPFTHHSFDILPGSLGSQAKTSIVMNYLSGLGLAPDK